jgi:hypothetical protein
LTPQYLTLFFTKMDKYQTFYTNYYAVTNEGVRGLMMKDFMLSLSSDELIDWLREGNKDIVNYISTLIQTKEPENLARAEKCIQEVEGLFKKDTVAVSKAA